MKIFPSIILSLLGLATLLPFSANFFGFGLSSLPAAAQNIAARCNTGQKDKYGRCPYTSSSRFRSFSLGNSTGGSGSFGGSK